MLVNIERRGDAYLSQDHRDDLILDARAHHDRRCRVAEDMKPHYQTLCPQHQFRTVTLGFAITVGHRANQTTRSGLVLALDAARTP